VDDFSGALDSVVGALVWIVPLDDLLSGLLRALAVLGFLRRLLLGPCLGALLLVLLDEFERVVQALEHLLHVLRENRYLVPVEVRSVAFLAFYNLEEHVTRAVLLHVEEIRSVVQCHLCCEKFTTNATHFFLP